MAIPATGALSMNMFNVEVGVAGTTSCNLNQTNFRTLAGAPTALSQIAFANFYGKSWGHDTTTSFLTLDLTSRSTLTGAVFTILGTTLKNTWVNCLTDRLTLKNTTRATGGFLTITYFQDYTNTVVNPGSYTTRSTNGAEWSCPDQTYYYSIRNTSVLTGFQSRSTTDSTLTTRVTFEPG